jgi:UDP-glucose 4-epimerase
MKALVTGGAGYVGTELVRALTAHPAIDEVIVYDNLSRNNHNLFLQPALPTTPIRFVRADLLDTHTLQTALDGVDLVFHLAAKVSTPFADEDVHGFDQVNHWGTAELGYALERQRSPRPDRRLIYLSSTAIYGTPEHEATEQTDPAPRTAYGRSKHAGERMLERLADQLALYTVRSANVYGHSPSMRFDAVINRFMFEAHFSGRITIHGSGQQHRAFVYVQSVARALTALALDPIDPGTYNLVERNLSVLEIVSHLQDLYPDVEQLFIQQDVKLRDLRVQPDPRLSGLLEPRPFEEQLLEFLRNFAFRSSHSG